MRKQHELVAGIGYVPASALVHLCTWLGGLYAQTMYSITAQVVSSLGEAAAISTGNLFSAAFEGSGQA